MAWVRRTRTASGATAVQIAESVAGRRRIVRHVGSARDEAELGLLIAEAHRLLADNQQGILDLGITPALPKATMVPAAQAGLFADAGAASPSRQLVARPRAQDVCRAALRNAGRGVRQPRVRRRGRRSLPRPGDRPRRARGGVHRGRRPATTPPELETVAYRCCRRCSPTRSRTADVTSRCRSSDPGPGPYVSGGYVGDQERRSEGLVLVPSRDAGAALPGLDQLGTEDIGHDMKIGAQCDGVAGMSEGRKVRNNHE